MAIDLKDHMAELDINPLLVTPQEAIALDARVLLDHQAILHPVRRYSHLAIRPYPEEYVRHAAQRALLQLQALDARDALVALIGQVKARTGRAPVSWADLVDTGALRGIPVDPTGAPFAFDPATGTVTLSPASPLLPLPPGLSSH